MIPTFIRAYAATAAIAGCLIVRFSEPATSNGIAEATANDQPFLGVSDRMGAELGGMCDVHRAGLAGVRLGGPVEAGDPLTSDDEGRAIKAVAAAGETIRIVGWADQPGVENDIIDAFISPTVLHEPAA